MWKLKRFFWQQIVYIHTLNITATWWKITTYYPTDITVLLLLGFFYIHKKLLRLENVMQHDINLNVIIYTFYSEKQKTISRFINVRMFVRIVIILLNRTRFGLWCYYFSVLFFWLLIIIINIFFSLEVPFLHYICVFVFT
jgi:hypothetical protein